MLTKDIEIVETINSAIDQQLKFLDSMEQIRWRFTTAFGLTAILTLLFLSLRVNPINNTTPLSTWVLLIAYAVVFIISLSGLITQVRIAGLFWGGWERVLRLQEARNQLLSEPCSAIYSALKLPPKDPSKQPSLHEKLLTVHFANLLIFSTLLLAPFALASSEYVKGYETWGLISLLCLDFLVAYFSLVMGDRYFKSLNKDLGGIA